MTSAGEVSLLLLRAGRTHFAADADLVTTISSAREAPAAPHAAALFGDVPVLSAERRLLYVADGQRALRLLVDAILGVRAVSSRRLKPLPPSLHALGAPLWLLGSFEEEPTFYWLLDLLAAAASLPEPT